MNFCFKEAIDSFGSGFVTFTIFIHFIAQRLKNLKAYFSSTINSIVIFVIRSIIILIVSYATL
jgi:hypothetical protein